MLSKFRVVIHNYLAVVHSALENEDLATAHYLKAAHLGSSDAQNQLGTRYAEGKGVELDHVEAAKWFKLSAEEGNMYAQANIGWFYYEGLGVTQSYEMAIKWYQRAAEKGHPESQYNLGLMYADSLGTKRNDSEAIKWFSKAKANGISLATEAMENLQNET